MTRAASIAPSAARRARSYALVGAGVVALAATAVWLTRPSLNAFGEGQFLNALLVLLSDAPPVLGWLLAAWGLGSLLRHALCLGESLPPGAASGLGIAAMLWLEHALGAAGWLQAGGGIGAWGLLAVCWVPALLALRNRLASLSSSAGEIEWSALLVLAAAPAAAVLLVAATSAPGWLWSSEAHGYDVLEYHLQLPREWLARGSLAPLTHNVYSFAPSYVEAAFYHLAILLDPFAVRPADGAIAAATACQLLHAALMIWAACEVAMLAARFTSRLTAIAAGAIAISVPWAVVTGSMAYDEAVLLGLLALGWRLVDSRPSGAPALALIGFLAGVACGAKLTALGSVAMPLGVLILVRSPVSLWPKTISACTLGGAIALGPYLIRNFAALDGGNPFFPLFMKALGSAHWTAEQMERWNRAHAPDRPWIERLATLWAMGFAHAQWAGLWLIALLAAPAALLDRRRRRAAGAALLLLASQVAFWLTLTHLQSRFLLPCLPPLVVLVASGVEELARRARGLALVLAALLPAGLGCWCIHLYGQERGGKPATYIDGVVLRTGVSSPGVDPGFLRELTALNSDVYLTHFTDGHRGVYLFGDATPFYVLRPVAWHTTWDTSPLGEIIRAHGEDHRAWAAALLERGLPLVLVNEAELHRLAVVDRWYDPDVAAADWRGFFASHARPVKVWPISAEHRRILYEIIPPR